MSRFLFSTIGSLGDLHPYIAIARALIDEGHEAVIATAREYRDNIEGAGVDFAEARPNVSELGDYPALIATLFDIERGPEHLIREVVMPYLRPSYDALMEASADADLLVSQTLAMTLPIVAERRGLPWVATILAPMGFMSSHDPPLVAAHPGLHRLRWLGPAFHKLVLGLFKRSIWGWEAPLRALRREVGASPLRHLALFEGQYSPYGNLALFDAPLGSAQPDWPARTRICGSPVYDGAPPSDDTLARLDAFLAAGEPPIVFALGSAAVWIADDFWSQSVAAARALGRRAILITGPSAPEDLPEGVQAFPYLPYSKVFPRAAAIVHQAGIGTLAQALRSGRPQLMVPVAFDQPDNARRAAALGLGRILPFRQVETQRLTSELNHLLGRPAYSEAAHFTADTLIDRDGARQAADALIETLRSPIR